MIKGCRDTVTAVLGVDGDHACNQVYANTYTNLGTRGKQTERGGQQWWWWLASERIDPTTVRKCKGSDTSPGATRKMLRNLAVDGGGSEGCSQGNPVKKLVAPGASADSDSDEYLGDRANVSCSYTRLLYICRRPNNF